MSITGYSRNEEVVKMYEEGRTMDYIAVYFGITKPRVHQILHRAGSTAWGGSAKLIKLRNEEIARLYADGVAKSDIASMFKITVNHVQRILASMNINCAKKQSVSI